MSETIDDLIVPVIEPHDVRIDSGYVADDPLTESVEKFISECKEIHEQCRSVDDKLHKNIEPDFSDATPCRETINGGDLISDLIDISDDISDVGLGGKDITDIEGGKTTTRKRGSNMGTSEMSRRQTSKTGKGSSEPYPDYTKYVVGTGVKLLPTANISECSLISGKDSTTGESCISETAVAKIASSVGTETDVVKIVEKLGCQNNPAGEQACVLERQKVLSEGEKQNELRRNFKIAGPTNVDLLNNINIDDTLKQWQLKFSKFHPYNFNMADYEEHNDSLATVDVAQLYKSGINTAACVINSDKYSGKGKHWMALFLDMRTTPCTAEFFNSSGNPPISSWVRWMDKCRVSLEGIGLQCEKIKVSDKVHQYSQTECGVYSLLYIWARLHGVKYSYFSQNRVPDQIMFEFRQHLFWDDSAPHLAKWDYAAFKARVAIKWEDDWHG
jgi:hypothetical protein